MGTLIGPSPVRDRRALLDRAAGWRCGTAVSVSRVPTTPADPPIEQWAATARPVGESSPAGGAGRTADAAKAAAVGELLERYAAARHPLPVAAADDLTVGDRILVHSDFTLHSPLQRADPTFPHYDSYARTELTRVHTLADNAPVWAPANLVSNDPQFGHLATSNGLAAGPTTLQALLRAAQELVERDALMITWLHQVRPRQVPVPESVRDLAAPVDAAVVVLDLTPAYSPHPVAAVAGSAPLAGRDRNGFGVACRATFADAVAKAALEWAQGVSFAGVNTAADPPGTRPDPTEVTDFDAHALLYTRRPDLWARLPLWTGEHAQPPITAAPRDPGAARDQLADLVRVLHRNGIELLYRDLTLPDIAACGVRVVRVLSPQLVPIHADHRWPHLGGSTPDLARRYPWAEPAGPYPSPVPHPLG